MPIDSSRPTDDGPPPPDPKGGRGEEVHPKPGAYTPDEGEPPPSKGGRTGEVKPKK